MGDGCLGDWAMGWMGGQSVVVNWWDAPLQLELEVEAFRFEVGRRPPFQAARPLLCSLLSPHSPAVAVTGSRYGVEVK